MAFVEQLQDTVRAVGDRVGPSVVRIGRGWGRGNGVVISEGFVLTNAHNLRGRETTVTFADGRTVTGAVAGADLEGDLAVLRVDTAGAPPISWEPATTVEPNSVVFAVVLTGEGGRRVTFGTVTATGREFRGPRGWRITGSVEHTVPLGRGSSGSPIVDVDGRFLGLNTNRLGDGFYLALPADDSFKSRVDALVRGESPAHLRLGVGLAPARAARAMRRAVGLPERDGLLVRVVEDESAADRAGLRQGDLLTEAGGRALTKADDLHSVLEGLGTDDTLALKVVRGTEDLDVRVSFAAAARSEGSA